MSSRNIRLVLLASVLTVSGDVPNAFAWGCDGHQAVALIAARRLGPTANAVRALLNASPVDPTLKRFCDLRPSDVLADASTWADDARAVDPTTAGWHFVDFPRALGAVAGGHGRYCPNGDCVIDAIVAQFKALTMSGDPRTRANALRFVVHLVGDIHQPLHAITNGDRGGNCLPITYFGQPPQEDEKGNFNMNLHRVWDSEAIRVLMKDRGLRDAVALADHLAARLPATIAAQVPTMAEVGSWARASNALARTVAYGRLPVPPPIESAASGTLATCADNNHIGRRMAALDERAGRSYQRAVVPVIVDQLALAAERLASVLKAAFADSAGGR
jgi:nuclease S1